MYDLMDRLEKSGWQVRLGRVGERADYQPVIAEKDDKELTVRYIPEWADGGAYEFNLNGRKRIFKNYVDGFEEVVGEKFYLEN